MNKVDCCMWTRNSARTLGVVLSMINQVIPEEVVDNKFIVDDHSIDGTREIAVSHGWKVYHNTGTGISDGANTALKHVGTDFFCSFEHDVLLSKLWWGRISPLILKRGVVAACGLRFLPRSNLCFSVEPYALTRRKIDYLGGFGKTLDNTIWNTNVLRKLGGFPKLRYAGIDTFLWHKIDSEGYRWLVDYGVQSLHLHSTFPEELRHYYFYGLSLPELYRQLSKFCNFYQSNDRLEFFLKFLKSPVSSLKMAKRMHDPRLLFSYPLIRFCWLMGYIRGSQ